MNEHLQQIRQLPVPDQILLAEQIWDGLHRDADVIQDWHRSEGRRRMAEVDDDLANTITKDELWSSANKSTNE